MKEKPDCPRCQNNLEPEQVAPGLYLCHCCGKTFHVPKGLRA